MLFKLFEEEPGGGRPEAFGAPRPQERVQRHTMEQLADDAPVVPALGIPELQMVDQLVAVLKPVDSSVPDQIIAVPKISLPSRPLRAALAATQMVEQLVEVPTDVVVLMKTDTEEEERRTWIDDNDGPWALIRPPGRPQPTLLGSHRRARAGHKYWPPWWSRNAWFVSGYILCVSLRRLCGRISHYFCVIGWTLDPEVDSRRTLPKRGSGRARRR